MADWVENKELQKALRENERKSLIQQWMRQRSSTVKESVTAHDILRHFGVTLKHGGSSQEEQISCPFHGRDSKPSGRVYPNSGKSASHVWCFTCQKSWDIFGLWKKFSQHEETVRFGQLVFELERSFGIVPPERPAGEESFEDTGPSAAEEEAKATLAVCERRLLDAKAGFTLQGYLTVGQLLDRIYFRLGDGGSAESELKGLRQILDKIAEKIAAKDTDTFCLDV